MRIADVVLLPEEAFDENLFPAILYKKLGLQNDGGVWVTPVKRSIDARGRNVCVRVQCEIHDASEFKPPVSQGQDYPEVTNRPVVIIVGSGPAGLFAALRLLSLGYKPIILERGKDVQSRRRDLAAINKDHIVNPDSNYCFGE